jgi:hypothetical protein
MAPARLIAALLMGLAILPSTVPAKSAAPSPQSPASVALASAFALRGYVTVSVDYRLREGYLEPNDPDLPQVVREAQFDVAAAVRWPRMHAAQYRVDPLRIRNGPSFQPPPAQGLFQDVPLQAWYARWVEEAYRQGILIPCQREPALRACPQDPLARDLAAVMMARAKGLLP